MTSTAGLLVCALWVAMAQDAPPATRPTTSKPAASQPTSRRSATATPPRAPDQAAVIRELLPALERRPIRPVASTQPAGVARVGNTEFIEGNVLIDRRGRLVRSGEHAEFQIASAGSAEPPAAFELQKNTWLEYMEREADAGATEFIITAEVAQYRGRVYLLLRSYRRPVDNGNLAP